MSAATPPQQVQDIHDAQAVRGAAVVGRFAPTPSGPLHLGSLFTALASWLDARAAGGRWLLRIDDLDRPRCVPGADRQIQRQLLAHGLEWDGPVRYQSQDLDAAREMLEALDARGLLYACRCTRRELAATSLRGPDGPVYPGRCRTLALPRDGNALRLRVGEGTACIDDLALGRVCRDAARDIGDFIVRRRDGLIGYQLACVAGDALAGVSRIVRGGDLLGSSLRQRLLIALLALPVPAYLHLPVLVRDGRKLSKQNRAEPIDPARAADNLRWCLRALGQQPAETDSVPRLLEQAVAAWRAGRLPRAAVVEAPPATAPGRGL